MGFLRDWFDRQTQKGPTEVEEMPNPLLGWRLQHFVCIPAEQGWLKHYFQFLDKEGRREEFIVFYTDTIGGYSYERTAHRRQPEESYALLSERGPWSMSISFLIDLGKRLPANTQSPSNHHATGVHIERRPAPPPQDPEPLQGQSTSHPSPAAHDFIVGEHVVYPKHGVGKIMAVEQQEIAGNQVELFVIHFKTNKMTLRIPTANLGKVGLRKLSDEL
ncbi:CarD family transcriptional regulator [Bradyrhizobium elkanii]|uniref:CarD-like/TRCF RNAP-interacting domain-containing protein n=1 Tax=Bradyrhizobium elkanii TaxID=29448 RepID=A0ABV4FAK3_BRAEL|nr:CarD family transcriptional regulator [Bradyrhizobium elkanii]MCP1752039.1 hypothetical protein [Bradyrhizobium elkanii]MCP1977810.1 hypothetical protein [Bradyrhizobium elkanii]MCS3887672.1 hypothetical protein [Bradyrhizobium elkanii]MCS4213309.1 hypothetical protein [Bradyrhizobium elkanii]MCW2213615.1 hypothetical protein [Bradyrhizobium elkanii]